MAAHEYPIHISKINIENEEKLRTTSSYIHSVLNEEGIQIKEFYEEDDAGPMTLGEVATALSSACAKLRDSGLYESVIFDIGCLKGDSGESDAVVDTGLAQINVKLEEKKWYKIYIGAGVKQQGNGFSMNESAQLGALPMGQFESSASLSNIRGCTDTTNFSYTVDQASTPTFLISHDAPSQIEVDDLIHSSLRCLVDTMDFEHARSYKEFQRSISYRLSNSRSLSPFLADGIWKSLHWTAVWRDILPCRFLNAPFACDASSNIIAEAGPSLKHSLSFEYRLNGKYLDNRLAPTRGFDFSSTTELAGPPGDVGFFKMHKFLSYHIPLHMNVIGVNLPLAIHSSLSAGLIKAIDFGGSFNCHTPISDRYFVGGPLQLRGFEATGIGPRAETVSPLL